MHQPYWHYTGSLVIEGNTLNLEQNTAVLEEGKLVDRAAQIYQTAAHPEQFFSGETKRFRRFLSERASREQQEREAL